MFANRLHIKRSINTWRKLGRLIKTGMGRMETWAAFLLLSNLLDWLIDLHLRYIENHGPVKLYNMQSLFENLKPVNLSYLNNTQCEQKYTLPLAVK